MLCRAIWICFLFCQCVVYGLRVYIASSFSRRLSFHHSIIVWIRWWANSIMSVDVWWSTRFWMNCLTYIHAYIHTPCEHNHDMNISKIIFVLFSSLLPINRKYQSNGGALINRLFRSFHQTKRNTEHIHILFIIDCLFDAFGNTKPITKIEPTNGSNSVFIHVACNRVWMFMVNCWWSASNY